MGWYGEPDCNRKQLVGRLTTSRKTPTGIEFVCLKHCYRGNPFRGVLWSAWEQRDSAGKTQDRWISCDLLEYHGKEHGWYYKPLDEKMEPHALSCPLGYLELVHEAAFPGTTSPEWRSRVRAYHAKKRLERGHRRNLKNSSCVEV
jgi:hypothetical protein